MVGSTGRGLTIKGGGEDRTIDPRRARRGADAWTDRYDPTPSELIDLSPGEDGLEVRRSEGLINTVDGVARYEGPGAGRSGSRCGWWSEASGFRSAMRPKAERPGSSSVVARDRGKHAEEQGG